MTTNYTLDDRHYKVELYKKDCKTQANVENAITFKTGENTNTPINSKDNFAHLVFQYNQTMVESSDLWTANKTGGNVEFCIKFSNFLSNATEDFAR